MIQNLKGIALGLALFIFVFVSACTLAAESAQAYTANKVWFDFLDQGQIRVRVQYTVPALKEFREAHAVFRKKKEAETFYWHLVRGGEFSVGGKAQLRFDPPKYEADPY